MISIDKIVKDGFFLEDKGRPIKHVAALSLRTSLKAYMATYSTMRLYVSQLQGDITPEVMDMVHNLEYCENAVETIIHFQHFVELICKDILSDIHPLLADEASRSAVVIYKLLNKQPLNEQEDSQIRLIEFTDALERVVELRCEGVALGQAAQVLAGAVPWLQRVNKLRNRTWHRGRFILHCGALDALMGCYVLPFIENLLAIQPYDSIVRRAQHKALHCGINPSGEIIKRYQTTSVDVGEIAFLKEMGRAAYESPLQTGRYAEHFNAQHRDRAERLAYSEETNAADIRTCPVCGVDTLRLFDDEDELTGDDVQTAKHVRYTYAAK